MMKISDANILELVGWLPCSANWKSEWLQVNERVPEGGFCAPSPDWLAWAGELLCQPRQFTLFGMDTVARILLAAEPFHPRGFFQSRLQEAMLALGALTGQDYRPADCYIQNAEENNIIRTDHIDIWRPGMKSGSGLRRVCYLTLYGKTIVNAPDMPEPFPPKKTEVLPWQKPTTSNEGSWWDKAMADIAANRENNDSTKINAPEERNTCLIPENHIWRPQVTNELVRKFFENRENWKEYVQAIKDVLDEKLNINDFGIQIGPKRIAKWINKHLRIPETHPKPCKTQNVTPCPDYINMIKAFKENPEEHIIVKRLRQGQSPEAKAILEHFLCVAGE